MAISEHTFDLELCPKSGNGSKFNAHMSFLSSFHFFDKVLGQTLTDIESIRAMTEIKITTLMMYHRYWRPSKDWHCLFTLSCQGHSGSPLSACRCPYVIWFILGHSILLNPFIMATPLEWIAIDVKEKYFASLSHWFWSHFHSTTF